MKQTRYLILSLLFLVSFDQIALAGAEYFSQTGLPLPRFVSFRTNEVNVRTGPGVKYPLEWVFVKKDLPIKVIAEFDHWRQIKDSEGNEGWVHKVMLSGHRTVIFNQDKTIIHAKPDPDSRKLALGEKNVIADFKGCDQNWCQIRAQNFKGWVEKSSIWGVFDKE